MMNNVKSYPFIESEMMGKNRSWFSKYAWDGCFFSQKPL